MAITKAITFFEYDELPTDKAKEKAREWFCEVVAESFSDYVSYDDFIEICDKMGVQIGRVPRKARNGSTHYDPQIRWSGFSSQGDGASFAGRYSSVTDAGAAIRAYAPKDETLHAIGDTLDALTAKYPNGITATITRPFNDRYAHEYSMDIDAMTEDDDREEVALAEGDADALQEAIRSLARWFYRYLEDDYSARLEDDSLADGIRANEYTFREDGKRENPPE